jgi:hypothetical protein
MDGQDVHPSQVRLRSRNFSQPWRTRGIVDVAYEVGLPDAYLVDWLTANLPTFVEDCLARPGREPAELLLRARDWPSARQILRDTEVLLAVVGLFAHDLLLEWFLSGTPRLPGYILNSVDRIRVNPGEVRLSGLGRRADRPVAYQDN